MKAEQERVKTVLIDTVSLLCKNGLHFDRELKIQAVIGVSVDFNEVFIVHINETINPSGGGAGGVGAVSSSASNADTTMAMVPYMPGTSDGNVQGGQMKRPLDIRNTPMSAAKRMRESGMSPMAGGSQPKAKQQLHFASPGKINSSPSRGGGIGMSPSSVRSPGMPPGSPMTRGSPRGVGIARGGMARGGSPMVAGRGISPRGVGRGSPRGVARGSPRGMVRASPRGGRMMRGSVRNNTSGAGSLKSESYADMSKQYNDSQSSHMHSSASASASASTSTLHYDLYNPFMPQTSTSSGPSSNNNTGMFQQDHLTATQNNRNTGYDFNTNYPLSEQTANVQLDDFANINPSVEFGFAPSSNFSSQMPANQPPVNIKRESQEDADIIFVEDDAAADASRSTSNASSNVNQSPSFVDPSGMYGDMSGSGDVVQHITRKVTITTNIKGQNVKYEQVQHAVMPVSSAPDEGNASLDSAVNPGQMYSDVPMQSMQSMQSGGNQYQPGVDLYGQQTSNISQQMWDQAGAMPHQTMRQPNPHSAMKSPGMASMGQRMPVPRNSVGASGRGARQAGPGAVRPRGGNLQKVSGAGARASSGNMPRMAETGGSVEDGSAWGMIARFVCNVPGCGAQFTKKQNLHRHQTQKHGRPKQTVKQRNTMEDYGDDLEGDDTEGYDDEDGGYM